MSVHIPFTGKEYTVTVSGAEFTTVANGQCAHILTDHRDSYAQGDIIYLRVGPKLAWGKRMEGHHIAEGDAMALTLCVTMVQGAFLYRPTKEDKGRILNLVSVMPVDDDLLAADEVKTETTDLKIVK